MLDEQSSNGNNYVPSFPPHSMFFSHASTPHHSGGPERLKLQSYRTSPYHYSQHQRKSSPTDGKTSVHFPCRATSICSPVRLNIARCSSKSPSHTRRLMCYSGLMTLRCSVLSSFSNQSRPVSIVVHLALRSLVVLHVDDASQYAVLVIVALVAEHGGRCRLLFQLLLSLSCLVLFPVRNNAVASVAPSIHGASVLPIEQWRIIAAQSLVLAPPAARGHRFQHEQSLGVVIAERTRESLRRTHCCSSSSSRRRRRRRCSTILEDSHLSLSRSPLLLLLSLSPLFVYPRSFFSHVRVCVYLTGTKKPQEINLNAKGIYCYGYVISIDQKFEICLRWEM